MRDLRGRFTRRRYFLQDEPKLKAGTDVIKDTRFNIRHPIVSHENEIKKYPGVCSEESLSVHPGSCIVRAGEVWFFLRKIDPDQLIKGQCK